MAYIEFLTLKQVEKKFGVQQKWVRLFEKDTYTTDISIFLENDIEEAKKIALIFRQKFENFSGIAFSEIEKEIREGKK